MMDRRSGLNGVEGEMMDWRTGINEEEGEIGWKGVGSKRVNTDIFLAEVLTHKQVIF